MFLRILSVEWRKYLKHPLPWLALASLVGILGLYFSVRYALIASSVRQGLSNTRGLELDLQIGLGLFGFLSILYTAVTAGFISAGDFADRGVQQWLVRGAPRSQLLLARLLTSLLVGLFFAAAAVLASLGCGALARSLFLGGFDSQQLDWGQVFIAVLRMFWGMAPYTALAVLFGTLGRSPFFAAGGTLVFRTILESALANLSDRLPGLTRFLPGQLAFVLEFHTYAVDRSALSMQLGDAFLSEPQAVLVIGGMLVLLGALAVYVFKRQDWGG